MDIFRSARDVLYNTIDSAIDSRKENIVELILSENGKELCSSIYDLKIKILGKGNFGQVFTDGKIAVKEERLRYKPVCDLKGAVYKCNAEYTSFPTEIITNYWFRKHPDPAHINLCFQDYFFICEDFGGDPSLGIIQKNDYEEDEDTTEKIDQEISVFSFMKLEHGTLGEFWGLFTEKDKIDVSLQLYHAFLYMQRIGVSLNDITRMNILVSKLDKPLKIEYRSGTHVAQNYIVKYTDFGAANIKGLLDNDLFPLSRGQKDISTPLGVLFYLEFGLSTEMGPETKPKVKDHFGNVLNDFLFKFSLKRVSEGDYPKMMAGDL